MSQTLLQARQLFLKINIGDTIMITEQITEWNRKRRIEAARKLLVNGEESQVVQVNRFVWLGLWAEPDGLPPELMLCLNGCEIEKAFEELLLECDVIKAGLVIGGEVFAALCDATEKYGCQWGKTEIEILCDRVACAAERHGRGR